ADIGECPRHRNLNLSNGITYLREQPSPRQPSAARSRTSSDHGVKSKTTSTTTTILPDPPNYEHDRSVSFHQDWALAEGRLTSEDESQSEGNLLQMAPVIPLKQENRHDWTSADTGEGEGLMEKMLNSGTGGGRRGYHSSKPPSTTSSQTGSRKFREPYNFSRVSKVAPSSYAFQLQHDSSGSVNTTQQRNASMPYAFPRPKTTPHVSMHHLKKNARALRNTASVKDNRRTNKRALGLVQEDDDDEDDDEAEYVLPYSEARKMKIEEEIFGAVGPRGPSTRLSKKRQQVEQVAEFYAKNKFPVETGSRQEVDEDEFLDTKSSPSTSNAGFCVVQRELQTPRLGFPQIGTSASSAVSSPALPGVQYSTPMQQYSPPMQPQPQQPPVQQYLGQQLSPWHGAVQIPFQPSVGAKFGLQQQQRQQIVASMNSLLLHQQQSQAQQHQMAQAQLQQQRTSPQPLRLVYKNKWIPEHQDAVRISSGAFGFICRQVPDIQKKTLVKPL
ncbi:unnamed protein product, partial [Amoebophrya sp. A25]